MRSRLEALKTLAQSEVPAERAQAQLAVGGHLFEVKDRGRGKFAYVLKDNLLDLGIRGSESGRLPLAYVQVSSELLTAEGVEGAVEHLQPIVNTLGVLPEEPRVSRADMCVDFLTTENIEAIPLTAFLCRARNRHTYAEGRQFSGITLGAGGALMARLYDKTLEVKKSGKTYLYELWAANGWDGLSTVWRLEFQLKRSVLGELGVRSVPELLHELAPIWGYCTSQWLRLAVVDPQDDTPARWPTHDLWTVLQKADFAQVQAAIRVRACRLPQDRTLFVNGLGGLTSFMASRGITDFAEGFGEYIAAAEDHHGCQRKLREYVFRKVAEKGRRFNTLYNGSQTPEEQRELDEAAEQYRAAKDGE